MKKLTLLALVSLCALHSAFAQEFRGQATYESKITLPEGIETETPKLDDATNKLVEEALASALQKTYILNFDKNASLFEEEKKLKPTNPSISIMVSVGTEGIEYKNIKEKKMVTETTLFDKEFLIVDNLEQFDWKLEKETKKIGNYTCYKATSVIKNDEVPQEDTKEKTVFLGEPKERKITAWYTPEVPVSHGPGAYWGLPGLILEVNDGVTTLLCSKIVLNSKDKTEIKAPKKGKKVTAAEFRKIEEEKAKEFEQQQESDGDTMIIHMGG